jgi:hypothetical protein
MPYCKSISEKREEPELDLKETADASFYTDRLAE